MGRKSISIGEVKVAAVPYGSEDLLIDWAAIAGVLKQVDLGSLQAAWNAAR